MKITLDSNLYIYKVFDPPVELDLEDGSTIKRALESFRGLLGSASESFQFIQENGEIGSDIGEILVNGKDYLSLGQGLRTSLKEGDSIRVEILNFPLSGG